MNNAFEYILQSGGIVREEDYPYTGTDRGTCKFDKSKIVASVSNFSVVSLDEEQIAANLVRNGPLAGSYLFSEDKKNLLPYLLVSFPLHKGIIDIYLFDIISFFKRTKSRIEWQVREILLY